MPTTEPTYGWPLPEAADPPDGPGQITALAAGVAATFTAAAVAATINKTSNQVTTQTNGSWFTLTGVAATASQGAITANSSGITITAAGLYLVSIAQRVRNNSATGTLAAAIYESGSDTRLLECYVTGGSGENWTASGSRVAQLAAGATLRIQMYGNGQEQTIYGGASVSALTAVRIGP